MEKVKLLAFYNLKIEKITEFSTKDVSNWFATLNLPKPNTSRLQKSLKKSKEFISGAKSNHFQLHLKEINKLDEIFPALTEISVEVISHDLIITKELYENTRGYIESLSKQINACYENNIFDGCAVLMRRLLEVLLILCYEHLNIENIIQDSNGNYKYLDSIINDAKNNNNLSLSRNTKSCLDGFRKLGNFSAHKIYYNCKKKYIDDVIIDYRATIEELLFKSNLKR